MKAQCQIVRDLLPLYAEDLASPASRELVQKHVGQCECCRNAMLEARQEMPIPMDTDVRQLRELKGKLRKKVLFPVLLTLFLALTVFVGLMVYAIVPVWATADEAIVGVEQLPDGRIRVEASDCVSGIVVYNNSFCFEKRRLDWFYSDTLKELRAEKGHFFYFRLEEGESLWYSGRQTGKETLLLWGDGLVAVGNEMDKHAGTALRDLFWLSLGLGLMCAVLGVLLRKRRIGHVLLHLGAFAICCGGACLFTTDGYFLTRALAGNMIRFNRSLQQAIAIAVLSVLGYLCTVLGWKTLKIYKD